MSQNLETLTVPQLKEMADKAGIPYAKSIRKPALLAALRSAPQTNTGGGSTQANTPEVPSTQAPAAQVAFSAHAPIGSKAHAMREKLAIEPKVRVFISLAPGEKQGVTQSVVLNGYPLYIRKGTYVDVPQSVAEVLEVKLKHKMTVENHPSRVKSDGVVELTGYGN